jgi:DNA polymerase-3 subunit alpha
MSQFIHLRVHSEFSITDGIVRLDEAVARAANLGMPALGIADLMNLFGVVKFYKIARSQGIQPIISCDVYLENTENPAKPYRLLLIAKNNQGYKDLCEILTLAYTTNQTHGVAVIPADCLDTFGRKNNLICLSGAHYGDVGVALNNGNLDEAHRRAAHWLDIFGDNFYLELQRLEQTPTENGVQAAIQLAKTLDIPLIATHPVQFMLPEDFEAHEARVCIAEGNTLGDPRRHKRFEPCQYFLSEAEMCQRFADIPEAVQNTVELAKRCHATLQLGQSVLPDFPIPAGMTIDAFLVQEATIGLEKRLLTLYPEAAEREARRPEYEARLKIETDTICQMGFPGYFLIVADFILWAKHNGCPVGPGRGSGAGSLVAYALAITDIDPLAYALLFERFLNPERVSMPDFDIDFCQENRYKVIEYVRNKYGSAAVSQIATFGTMAAKAVVRDVGRVLGMSYGQCDRISKLIPAAPGKQYSLDDALAMEPELARMVVDEEEVAALWALAKKLEGLTRNIGMHAGGVLIALGKITDYCPIYQSDGGQPISMLDKDDVESVGLVKFDFLGLRNLTIIDLSVQYIKQLQPDFSTDINLLPFTDEAAYKVLQQGNTTGVFQLESDGMKRLIEKLKPDRFEDIIAVLALYRPGPLGSGMVDDFIFRKNGKQSVDYYHPDLQACLEPTYGVIVYQEQVMQISQIIGGYTLGGADMLRRAMGKKKPEEMAEHRGKIAEGAQIKGYNPALAEMLFDLMAKFAEYGFNKSHTAAYAVISYQTAWLKAHHPAAFMAASMSSELDDTDQLKVFYDDALANQLTFLPPDVNTSFYRFVPKNEREIRYALGAIKGTGEAAVAAIVQERENNGPYVDLYDFCHRTDKKTVNKRTVEALIRAGAFDQLNRNRAELLANAPLAMEAAEQAAANVHQSGLFDDPAAMPAADIQRVSATPWTQSQELHEEKSVLGFYLSSHPFEAYQKEVRRFIPTPLVYLAPKREEQMIAGFVTAVRVKMGKKGKMVFVELDDMSQKQEIMMYSAKADAEPAEVARVEALMRKLKADTVMAFKVSVRESNFNGASETRVLINQALTWTEARSAYARALIIRIRHNSPPVELATCLAPYLAPQGTPGAPVEIHYQNPHAQGIVTLGRAWAILLDDALIPLLCEQLQDPRAAEFAW